MLNPLSIQIGTQKISGKEINDWCIDQILNHGSHEKDARRLFRKNYRDNRMYILTYKVETSGSPTEHTLVFRKAI